MVFVVVWFGKIWREEIGLLLLLLLLLLEERNKGLEERLNF